MPLNADKIKPETVNPWQEQYHGLTEVALSRFAIKTDRFGQYDPRGGASWSKKELPGKVLKDHFRGKKTIGFGSISPDDFCLSVAADLDNHVSEQSTNQNLAYAIVVRDRLIGLGFTCVIIEDSDGKGGIHLWVLFDTPVPSALAHRFIKWLVRDYKKHGLEKIEAFPKSPSVQHTKARCGNYLRLPGKHHKRDHWSRFYGASDWLTPSESVQIVLNITGNSSTLIPDIAEEPPADEPPRSFAYSPSSGASRDEAPEQIKEACLEIQATWPPDETLKRLRSDLRAMVRSAVRGDCERLRRTFATRGDNMAQRPESVWWVSDVGLLQASHSQSRVSKARRRKASSARERIPLR